MDIFSTDFNPSWTGLRGWSWGFLSSTAFPPPSAMNFTGWQWLPIEKRIRFKIALLVRHCIVGAALEYLTELCRPVSSSSGRQCLCSASRGDLIVLRFRLRRSGYRAFAVSGPHVWNSFPTEIRQSCNNLLQFRSKLKTFLFQQSWALLWIHI